MYMYIYNYIYIYIYNYIYHTWLGNMCDNTHYIILFMRISIIIIDHHLHNVHVIITMLAGAVLFAVEAHVKMMKEASCTSQPCAWLQPTPIQAKGVLPSEIGSIDFSSSSTRHKTFTTSLSNAHTSQTTCTPPISLPTQHEADTFYRALWQSGKRSAILSVLPGYCEPFVPSASKVPKNVLKTLFDPDKIILPLPKLLIISATLYNELTRSHLTSEEIHLVEQHTKAQSRSSLWFNHRSCRITASTIKSVCRTSLEKPSVSLLKRICYPEESKFSTVATK